MIRYNTIILRFTGVLVVFLGFFIPGQAQEDIQEELYHRDSLIAEVGQENIDTSYTYQWNRDSARWELFGRDLEFYKAKNELLAVLEQKWNPNRLQYINAKRIIKSYGRKGKVVESLQQQWDTLSNDWVNLELKTMTYDQAGNKSEILYQEWKRAVGRWISTTRYLIDYNRRGEKSNIVIRSYHPETDNWSNYQRYLFQYDDGFGPPDEALVQNWDVNDNSWEKQGRYTMRYNFRGQKTIESRATWNESLRKWINGLRYQFSYSKDQKTDQVLQRWDYTSGRWYNAVRRQYKYNDEDELKEELTYRWNEDAGQWVLKNRLLYSRKKPDVQNRQKGESEKT